jgi:lipid-A-disaccharide synthase
MAKYLDQLGVIFPFEKACFADTELPTTFLGHPLVSSQHAQTLFYDKDGPILLLPGSRTQAIQRIYPVLLEAFRLFSKQYPDFARPAITIYPDDSVKATLEAILAKFHQLNVTLQPSSTTIRASAALTSSGTMSLKCALAGIPHAIAYKAHPLSYLLGRFLVKIPFLGIANILLQKPAFPEFIQQNASPATLCTQLYDALSSPQRLTHTQSVAHEVKNVLSQNATTPADWLGKELVG